MLRHILALLAALPLLAQTGLDISISQGPPQRTYEVIYGYTGTNLIYACYSPSVVTTGPRAVRTMSITAISKANPAVVTVTGHGFNANVRPQITISGATGTGWTAVNATWTATFVDANNFSIPIDSTGFGTLGGTVVATSTAPRTNLPDWAVVLYSYDGSNNLINKNWLNGSSGMQAKCSDATSSATNIQ